MRGDKVQTSLWLDIDVKRLIEDEHLNLTKWVNDNILIALSVDNERDILERIKEKKTGLRTLEERLKTVRGINKRKKYGEAVSTVALEELRHGFVYRKNEGLSKDDDLIWIGSPKNMGRCKILKKTSMEVLNELEAWYDGIKKDHN